jgi:D-aminopeptidase
MDVDPESDPAAALAALGVRIGRLPPGPANAITDVAGVRVGHATVVRGPDVRTGVTAVLPHGGDVFRDRVEAAVHVINGFGKSVGLPQVHELGELETPILLTGTLSVWRAADALTGILLRRHPDVRSFNPVVCECNDGHLNDAAARAVGPGEVAGALDAAGAGKVAEGCVGAGTGMSGFGFKAGIGTSSRKVAARTVGVLVLTNTGAAGELRIDGIPVGAELARRRGAGPGPGDGSIIILMATDAPLSSRQLGRLARRGGFGLARAGATAAHGSGDFVLAFSSTARARPSAPRVPEEAMSELFAATIEATEEAIVRSLLAARTTRGRAGHVREALPLDEVAAIARRYRPR